jgi:uncharacterized DUF497 family protein
MLQFDWDDENRGHVAAHDVSCAEAEHVIKNEPFDLEFQTENGEERFVQLGETNAGRILVVVHMAQDLDPRDYSVRCTPGDETCLHRPEGEFVWNRPSRSLS